jgi:hypothetical protein
MSPLLRLRFSLLVAGIILFGYSYATGRETPRLVALVVLGLAVVIMLVDRIRGKRS